MPLFRVMAYAGFACEPHMLDEQKRPILKHDEFLVHAKDEARARAVVVAYLVAEEAYAEIPTFADPHLSMAHPVKSRAPEGIESVYMHHCQDHS